MNQHRYHKIQRKILPGQFILTEVREELAARFSQHDVDGDGFLQESDYQALTRLLGEQLGATATVREAIAAGYAEQWRTLYTHARTGRDGRVSREQYISAMNAADADALDRAVLQAARAIIQAADSDGDGHLDLSNFQQLGPLLRIGQPEQSFQALDTDHDGLLSSEELLSALRDFYTSDDPATPGNHIFGHTG